MFPKLKKYSLGCLFLGLVVLSACSDGHGNKTTVQYMPDMADGKFVKAQRDLGRLPPEGTVPVGFTPYPFGKEEGDLAMGLQNPIPKTKAELLEGQRLFNIYCIVCHGPTAKGDGLIVPKFPMPPSLHSEKVRNWSDGRIFHVITQGQKLMPSYANQIFPEERWKIINYMRVLQRAVNPTPDDVKAFQQALEGGSTK